MGTYWNPAVPFPTGKCVRFAPQSQSHRRRRREKMSPRWQRRSPWNRPTRSGLDEKPFPPGKMPRYHNKRKNRSRCEVNSHVLRHLTEWTPRSWLRSCCLEPQSWNEPLTHTFADFHKMFFANLKSGSRVLSLYLHSSSTQSNNPVLLCFT